jgi:putative membrane protein
VIWGAKGWDYYQDQPFFWAKIGAFALIGLISIVPTRTFMRWVKQGGGDGGVVPPADVSRARRLVMIETMLVGLLLLFASLMARGIGG